MTQQSSSFHDAVRPGEASGPPGLATRFKPRIASFVRRFRGSSLALVASACFAVAAVESCTAILNSDGTITFTFAPDMTIHAMGLEDALSQMSHMYRDCISGTWQRPCTPAEEADIQRTIDNIVTRKAGIGKKQTQPPGG